MRVVALKKLRGFALSVAACVCVALSIIPVAAQAPAGTEIVNVAKSRYVIDEDGGAPGATRVSEIDSNPVMNRVIGDHCFLPPTLLVDPATTVAPGARLQYRIRVENSNGADLNDVVVEMALNPALDPPSDFSNGPLTTTGGQTVPCNGSYEPSTHTVSWLVGRLADGDSVDLDVTTAARSDLGPDTLIEQIGEVHTEVCPDEVASNSVTTGVVPPVLQITKRADRTTVTVGDGVIYTFEIRHTGTDPPLDELLLVDVLPESMRFAEGSVRVNGEPFLDPEIDGDGVTLRLPLGPLQPGQATIVQLGALVGPASEQGEAVNHAWAEARTAGGAPIVSAPALASVVILPGPFRREAYLIGRVFVDDDVDSRPDEEEPGVPGVLVMLQDGRGAVTDITGRWHIEGVQPGLHVLRIDPGTLPRDLAPTLGGAEWAGDGLSRFIEARASTLVVADLPVGPPGAPHCAVTSGERILRLPFASLFDAQHNITPRTQVYIEAIGRWLADSGPIRAAPPLVSCSVSGPEASQAAAELGELLGASLTKRRAASGGDFRAPPPDLSRIDAGTDEATGWLEQTLRTAAPRAAILSPIDGSRAERSRIDIEVIHPLGHRPHLTVNGELVDPARIGIASELVSRSIAAARYVGVPLSEGTNQIEFRAIPPGGDPAQVSPVRSTVLLPDLPVELRVLVPGDFWVADGITPGLLSIEAVDAAGVRSPTKLIVTLDAERAVPITADLDPEAEGHQVRLRDGVAQVRFAPLTVPGRVHVLVQAEMMETEAFVEVRAGAGSWRVTGLAEGRFAGDAGVEGDGGLAPGLDDGISGSGGRVALFARGPVGDSSRLTVSLDTARTEDPNRWTNDFAPGQFFPVSGDGSAWTDEAPTQGKLFARLDGPGGYAQWGDFHTGFDNTELARYDRRMTGASGKYSTQRLAFEGFATSSEQEVVRDVFGADGTSGPFLLTRAPIVARSETVIVEVRDRFQNERVLSRTIKRRDIEYNLDPVAGTLLFHAPIQPFDPDLNPVRVVVLYESREGGDDRITAGGRMSVRAGEKVRLGATAIFDERVGEDLKIYGADLTWRPAPGTVVEGEVAASEGVASATATRLEVRSRPSNELEWELHYLDLPVAFNNPTYLGEPEVGSRRYGGSVGWRPDPNWRLKGEAFVQQDEVIDLEQKVAGVEAERRMGSVTAKMGAKTVDSSSALAGDQTSNLLSAGVRAPFGPRWVGELFHEQALGDENAPGFPTRTMAGIGWQINASSRAFLRQEFQWGSGTTRNRTLVGVESMLSRHTRALFNYSLDGTASGYALRSLTGVETVLPVGPRSSIQLSAARLNTDSGDRGMDYTTLAGGYAFNSGTHLFSTRYELRLGTRDNRHLLTASGAMKPGEAWTVFAREQLSRSDPNGYQGAWRAEGMFGTAFRPRAGRWRFLARLDHSTSSGAPATPGGVPAGTAPSEPGSYVAPVNPVPTANGLGLGVGRSLVGRDWLAISFAAGSRLTARQRLATSVTMRRADNDPAYGLPSTLAQLLSLHYTAQIHRRWTVGASLRRFSERETAMTLYGQGVEAGYLVMRNLWVTGGYNFAGLEDGDFPGAEHASQGPFLSLRFKFDEDNLVPWRNMRLDQ